MVVRPDIRDGVYIVTDASRRELLGSSVRVAVRGHDKSAFLLTAGHSVHEEYLAERPVRLFDRHGQDCGTAKVVFSQIYLGGYDVALLQSESRLGLPLHLHEARPAVDGYVRGSPAGLCAKQTNMRCWIGGDEQVGPLRLLDVTLLDFQLLDPSDVTPGDEPLQAALVGLSGGPVIVADAVAGIVSRRDRSPIANHVFASPSLEIARCLSVVGYELDWQAEAAMPGNSSIDKIGKAYIADALQSQEKELDLWELLSRLFYGGERTDLDLAAVVDLMADRGGVDELSVLRGRFLLGRFALKRGDIPQARSLLTEVSRVLRGRRDADARILQTLAELRLLVEATPVASHHPMARANDLHRLIGVVEECAASDRQKAYEISSATGREALMLSMAFGRVSDRGITSEFSRLQTIHNGILNDRPDELYDKQGMVEFMLDAVACLWHLDGASSDDRPDRLSQIVASGRRGALDRNNVNFHFPMLLTQTVADKWRGQTVDAYTGIIVTGGALRRAQLALGHEGVCHVLAFMGHKEPELAALLRLAYQVPDLLIPERVEADSLLQSSVARSALADAVERGRNARELTANELSRLNVADL